MQTGSNEFHPHGFGTAFGKILFRIFKKKSSKKISI
jgi:hypothetical protein